MVAHTYAQRALRTTLAPTRHSLRTDKIARIVSCIVPLSDCLYASHYLSTYATALFSTIIKQMFNYFILYFMILSQKCNIIAPLNHNNLWTINA